jgi:hypothetical protein
MDRNIPDNTPWLQDIGYQNPAFQGKKTLDCRGKKYPLTEATIPPWYK